MCEQVYGMYPELQIEGHTTVAFTYARVHLEYCLFEILKVISVRNSLPETTFFVVSCSCEIHYRHMES